MNKLRQRFIRIAMLSLIGVLAFLTLMVNGTNVYLTFLDQRATLDMICESQGHPFDADPPAENERILPEPPGNSNDGEALKKNGIEEEGRFTKETPFTTRFFVLRFDDDGKLSDLNLDSIAAVTEDNLTEYLAVAVAQKDGYGLHNHYLFYVENTGEDHHMAFFLDCYQAIRALKIVLFTTLAVDLFCAVIVYLILLRFSRKAIDPIVKNNAAQKQFITDAGHELKTPLTVLTTNLKLLEMETGENKWITKAQHQTEKLVELVNLLIELSRMDETDSPLVQHDFNLSAAALEIVDSFRDFAQEQGRRIETDLEKNIHYYGDEGAIRRLLTILTDNAIKYAAEDMIQVRLLKERHHIAIETCNACRPMEDTEIEKLFDRFYRPSSSITSKTKGFGIGLSAAKSIVTAHKGNITATCPEAGKIQFRVVL